MWRLNVQIILFQEVNVNQETEICTKSTIFSASYETMSQTANLFILLTFRTSSHDAELQLDDVQVK